MSAVIEHTAQARLVVRPSSGKAFKAVLRFHADDPLAVRLVFPADASLDGAEAVWTFGRDLLAEGLRGPAGAGDVRLRPDGPGRTVVELHALEGVAMLEFRTDELRDFLQHCAERVPAGREHVRLRAALERELAGTLRGVPRDQ